MTTNKMIQHKEILIVNSPACTQTSLQGSPTLSTLSSLPSLSRLFQLSCNSFLHNEWKIIKRQVESLEYGFEQFSNHCGFENADMLNVVTKGKIMAALLALESKHRGCTKNLAIVLKPTRNVKVTSPIQKGKMTLVPSTPAVSLKSSKAGLSLGEIEGQEWYLHPHVVGPEKDGSMKSDSFLCPFWLVRKTHDTSEANVEIKLVNGGSDALKIPVMQNKVALKEGDVLMLYVEKLPDAEPEALIPFDKPTGEPATIQLQDDSVAFHGIDSGCQLVLATLDC